MKISMAGQRKSGPLRLVTS